MFRIVSGKPSSTPIAGIVDCCARARSGHTATALPGSVTKSRRLIVIPKAKDHTVSYGDRVHDDAKVSAAEAVANWHALLRYVRLRDAGLGSLRRGRSCKRKGVGFGCDLTPGARQPT